MFLAAVALLPLHTVYLHAWISWKPWIVLFAIVVIVQATDGWRKRTWPWHRAASIGLAVFMIAVAASWSGGDADRYLRLLLAVGLGGAVMLVTERELRRPGMPEATMRAIYWSAAAMALTALIFSLVAVGTFGGGAGEAISRVPLLDRVTKEAYLANGFVALTNWHQDPGYAAVWMNLWAVLAFLAIRRGLGANPALDAFVVGGLWFGVVMTLSRSGLLGLSVGVAVVLWMGRDDWRRSVSLVARAALAAVLLTAAVWALDRPDVGGDLAEAIEFRVRQGVSLGPGEGAGEPGTGVIDYRGNVWPIYWAFFKENPVRGAGLGAGWAAAGVQEPHNLILELLGETGLLGLAGFAFLFLQAVRSTASRVGAAALVVALSTAATQTVLFEASWWFAVGLMLAPPPARSP